MTMEKLPHITVGVPVYNGEKYLAATVDSILAQTFTDFELVISDNGSTDRTQAMCEGYAARDPRVRYFREAENRGAPWNINRVVELARGEFFKWQSADDTIAPTFLEKCVEVFRHDPELGLVMSRAAPIDGQGSLIDPVELEARTGEPAPRFTDDIEAYRWDYLRSLRADRRFKGILLFTERCFEEFGLLRKTTLLKSGLHRPYRGSEKVCVSELAIVGRFGEIPEVLFFNRWHDDRFSALGTAAQQLQWVNPKAKAKFIWPRQLRCAWGYLWACFRMRMGVIERIGCLAAFAQWVLRPHKWIGMLRESFLGKGMNALLPKPKAATAEVFSAPTTSGLETTAK